MPDALVSDYRLAGGSTGFEVVSEVRARFGHDLPAVIISGDTDPALLRDMTLRGIVVLHKPLDLGQLQAHLADLISPVAAANI